MEHNLKKNNRVLRREPFWEKMECGLSGERSNSSLKTQETSVSGCRE